MQFLYITKYETLMKKIKDLKKWKDSHVHSLEDLILLKQQHSPNRSVDSTQSIPKPQLPFWRN